MIGLIFIWFQRKYIFLFRIKLLTYTIANNALLIIAGIKIADNTIKGCSFTDINLLKANNAKTKSIRIKVVTLCI